ncbi:hypothetical protein VNO77_28017 [Canavalia gladiata]|uniref:Uncharacterized protein n=1 Tax=Canavalia gladiata TaxID=3824 RepID=A0AAN9KXX6_CANGL
MEIVKMSSSTVNNEEEVRDFISALPDSILSAIVSLLPDTQGVRTCVLSKRWIKVWKQASWLKLDQRRMLKDSIEAYVRKTSFSTRLVAALSRKFVPYGENDEKDAICMAEMLINSILDSHASSLRRCSIRHMSESCASGQAVKWIKTLLHKNKVKELTMEREWPNWSDERHLHRALKNLGWTLDFPFEDFLGFEKLELRNYHLKTSPSGDVSNQLLKTLTLENVNIEAETFDGILSFCLNLENLTIDRCDYVKGPPQVKICSTSLKFIKICNMAVTSIEVCGANLEVFEFDTVVCDPQKLIFETPKLRVLRSYFDARFGYRCYLTVDLIKLLTSKEILDTCRGLQNPESSPSRFTHIFQNLVTLRVGLDLKKVINAISLFTALKSCPMLQNLEVNNEVNNTIDNFNGAEDEEQMEDDILPYPKILFWKNREPCECIDHQLKTLCIRGYFGIPFEVEFLKYMITTAEGMKRLSVWFVDDCPWSQAIETLCLLSFPKASTNLSIDLHPGPVYMSKVDGTFEDWVSSLRG